MIRRIAAGLAVGLSSLFATAALACTAPACGAYAPASPNVVFAPPSYAQSPAYGPPPPETMAPSAAFEDPRPWPPAYAPSGARPSYYEAESWSYDRFGEHDRGERREFRDRRHGPSYGQGFGGQPLCGICTPAAPASLLSHEEVAPSLSDAFFYGGMSGGAGPGLEIAGPAGGGFGYSSGFGSSGFGFAHSFAYASATASASASVRAHGCPACFRPRPPPPHGCGCGHKGK